MKAGLRLAVLALGLTGCNRTAQYAEVVREQAQAFRELTEVLSTVTDEATMKSARGELRKRWDRFQQVQKKAKALSKPSEGVEIKLHEELGELDRSWSDLQRELRRIQDLPGGHEFLMGMKQLR